MSLKRIQIPSPNYSSRGGATVRLIVLHTAEGARTIQELGSFFANPSSQVSSHTGADDTPNTVGEYVRPDGKAWTAANANPVAVQIELCAFAAWTAQEWDRHPNMLANCAAWVAEESARFGVPITRLNASQAQGSGRGVCQHVDLGSWGGGHHDCGSAFPMDRVLSMAKGGGDEMGYPDWFWDWVEWQMTTTQDPAERPKDAPATIPDWAWDGQKKIQNRVAYRYGMTGDERAWVDWYLGQRHPEDRPPNVPSTIPERWWTDEAWVLARD